MSSEKRTGLSSAQEAEVKTVKEPVGTNGAAARTQLLWGDPPVRPARLGPGRLLLLVPAVTRVKSVSLPHQWGPSSPNLLDPLPQNCSL